MRDRSENKIRLVLIRHGAVRANKEHRYLGKTDEGLSAEGIGELQKAKRANRYPVIDYLFSSPMKRCLETAGILYPDREAAVIPEWEEMDFGDFEGKDYTELQGDARYQEWIDSNGALPFPNGESREDFIRRCEQGFYRMLAQLSGILEEKRNQAVTIGLVVHGGTVMALLSSFYGGEYFDYQAANGQGYCCELERGCEKIRFVSLEKI